MSDAKAAACLYIACNNEGLPILLKDIEDASQLCRKEIFKSFNLILKGDEASWFCDILSVSKEVKKAATFITSRTLDLGIVSEGVNNVVVVLAAIYMASQASEDKWTLKEISGNTGFTVVTIRKHYRLHIPHARRKSANILRTFYDTSSIFACFTIL